MLQVLEQQEFERVGGGETIKVDVRVISTSNRNLAEEVEGGRFRLDLYYRISGVRLVVPPVRERTEDIPALVWHFVNLHAREVGREINKLDDRMMKQFIRYDWPGNVRQIRNIVRAAMIFGEGATLSLKGASGTGAAGDTRSTSPDAAEPGKGGTTAGNNRPDSARKTPQVPRGGRIANSRRQQMVKPPAITQYLETALKGASIRQSVIANNIANLNSPGYRRSVVEFEKNLAEAIEAGDDVDLEEIRESILQPMNTPVDLNGNDVSLEIEIGEMIKNNAMYKTYMRVLGNTYRKMASAIQTP